MEVKPEPLLMHYNSKNWSLPELRSEREKQLCRISDLRDGREVLAITADLNKPNVNAGFDYQDFIVVRDLTANLGGKALDLILETPGGVGVVAEDIVSLLRSKFEEICVIVPGWTKSAGTIVAMSGDEILMEPSSALGPIDAQLQWAGKVFSADALLEGLEQIKKEVEDKKTLNPAYIPILQGISPGEIQNAINAQEFSKQLVADWLVKYKFKNWVTHSTTQQPVTADDRTQRAKEIAAKLCDHQLWRQHGRSIRIPDLDHMGLRITDYSTQPELYDAIRRYYACLHLSFMSNCYKVVETKAAWIARFVTENASAPTAAPPQQSPQVVRSAPLDLACPRCHTPIKIQADFEPGAPLAQGYLPFPWNDLMVCPSCHHKAKIDQIRRQIEAKTKRAVILTKDSNEKTKQTKSKKR